MLWNVTTYFYIVQILAAGSGQSPVARFCMHKICSFRFCRRKKFFSSWIRIAVNFSGTIKVMKLPVPYTMMYFNVIVIFWLQRDIWYDYICQYGLKLSTHNNISRKIRYNISSNSALYITFICFIVHRESRMCIILFAYVSYGVTSNELYAKSKYSWPFGHFCWILLKTVRGTEKLYTTYAFYFVFSHNFCPRYFLLQ
jgi:uncharacterized membrane protein